VPTHAPLARRVLEAGKHCFVEKPLAQSVAEAEEVVAAAKAAKRTLMVGHLLEYHPGLVRLKELVDAGELGRLFYIYGHRLNLGKLRADENALWSLGAHDISVILRLADEEPVTVEGPSWELRPGSDAYRRAAEQAVHAALARARTYAAALGAEITGLVEIADTGLSHDTIPPPPVPFAFTAAVPGAVPESAPPPLDLEPHPIQVRASVEATFTLAPPQAL